MKLIISCFLMASLSLSSESAQNRKISLVFSQSKDPVSFQLRLNSPKGQIISKGVLFQERDSENSIILSEDLENVSGTKDIYLVFKKKLQVKSNLTDFR